MDSRHDFALERSHLMPINTISHPGFTMNQNFESPPSGSNAMLRQTLSELGQSASQQTSGSMSFQSRFFPPTISLSASPTFPFVSNLLGNSSPAVSSDHFKNSMPAQFWGHTADGYPKFGLPGTVLPPFYSVGAMLPADEVGPYYSETRTNQSQPIYHRTNLYDTHKDLGLCTQNMAIGTGLSASGRTVSGLNITKGGISHQERKIDRKQNHRYESEIKKAQDKNDKKHKIEDFKKADEIGRSQIEERKKKNHVIPEKRHRDGTSNTVFDNSLSGLTLHGKSVIPITSNTFSKGFSCDSHTKTSLVINRIDKNINSGNVLLTPSLNNNLEKKSNEANNNGNNIDLPVSTNSSLVKEITQIPSNYSVEPPDKPNEKSPSATFSKLGEHSEKSIEETVCTSDNKGSQNHSFSDSSLHYMYDWNHDRSSNYASSHMVALAAQHGYLPPQSAHQQKNNLTHDVSFPLHKNRTSPYRSDKIIPGRMKESSVVRNKPLKKDGDSVKSLNNNSKSIEKNEECKQITPSDMIMPSFSNQGSGTNSIPIGIAVARQRQEQNAIQTSEKRSESMQADRLRLRADIRQPPHLRQREDFVREHKDLLAVHKIPSAPSGHDLNSNIMVLGAGAGHPSLPATAQWENQASVRTHIPPQWVQTSHTVSPAFWLGRPSYPSSMPVHQSGSLDTAHIPLTQGGYQIARDPISGHLLILANLDIVERHSVWPAYSTVPSHLQHSHQLQQLMAQQQQNQLQQHLMQQQQQQQKQQERQRTIDYEVTQQLHQQHYQQDRHIFNRQSMESRRPEKKVASIKVTPVSESAQAHLAESMFITHPPEIQDKCETKENSSPALISGIPLPHGHTYQYAYSSHPSSFPYFYESANVMPLSTIVPVPETIIQTKDSMKRSQGTSPVTTPSESTELIQCPSPEPELEQSKMENLEDENEVSLVTEELSMGDDLLEDEAIITKESPTEILYGPCSENEENVERESTVDTMTEIAPVLKEETLEKPVFFCYEEIDPPKIDIQVSPALPEELSITENIIEEEPVDKEEIEEEASAEKTELSATLEEILTEARDDKTPLAANVITEDSSSPLPPLLIKEPPHMTLYDGIEQILQVADGLDLLCTLAEQRILEESLKANQHVNNIPSELEQEEIPLSLRKCKSHSLERSTKAKIFIADPKIQNFKIDKSCIGQFTAGGYRIPPGAEGMDAIELEMRLRLAELQRKYKEKQRELARLQPKKEKERIMFGLLSSEHDKSPNKRGPGRPRKRKFFSMLKSCQPEKLELGKFSKLKSDSFMIHSSHGEPLKKRKKLFKDSQLLVSHLIKKSKASTKIIKAKKFKMSAALMRCRKRSVSSSTTDFRSKKTSSQDRSKTVMRKEKFKMFVKSNDEDSEIENINWLYEKEKLSPMWSSTPKIKTKDKSCKTKVKDGSKKSKKIITSLSSSILNPLTPAQLPTLQPLFPSDLTSDINEYEDTFGLGLLAKYATCVAAQLNSTKPLKTEPENLDNVISPAKKRKPGRPKKHTIKAEATETIVSKQSKNYTLMKMKALVEEKSNKKSKLKSESKTSSNSICFPYFEDMSWNRRRSERIFLNEASPSPALETSRNALGSAQLKPVTTNSSSSPISSNICSASTVKIKSDESTKLSMKPPHKEERSQIKKKLSKPKLDSDHKPRKSKDSKKVRPPLPSSSRKESLNKSSHVEDIYCDTLKENSRTFESILDSDSMDTSSFSEDENVPLSTLIERPMTPEPRSCTISKEELREGLRVLILVDGLFYAGHVNAIQAPDVYGVTLDGERGNRPHIYSREEILSEAIIEVRPTSTRFLTEGTRICAYWSQQYRCLYPGTISKSSMYPFSDKSLLNVEFDDGDSGRISLDDIRMLPTDYPIVAVDTSPIMLLGKRRCRTSEDTSSDMPRATESTKKVKRGRKPIKSSKKVSSCQNTEDNGLSIEEFHVLAEEMGENDVFEEPPLLARFSPTSPCIKQDDIQMNKKSTTSGSHNSLSLDASKKKIKSKKKNFSKFDKTSKSDRSSSKSKHPKKHKDRSDDHKHHHHHHKKRKHDKHSEDNFHLLGSSNNVTKKSDLTVKICTNSTDTAPCELARATSPDAVEPAALVKTNKSSSHSRPAPCKDSNEECNINNEDHNGKKEKCDKTDDENKKAKVSKNQDLDALPAAKKKRTERLPSTEAKSKIAAFLPARQLWKWFGKSTKRPGMKGKAKKEFYKAISRGKETIWTGDCAVFLSTGRPHLPYVGRIESLWESWGGNKVVKVKWFYHPEETKGGRRLTDTKGALYSSPHVDENDVQTISHKCEVLSWEDYKSKKLEDGRQNCVFDNDDIYYLAGSYDPGVGMVTSECDLD